MKRRIENCIYFLCDVSFAVQYTFDFVLIFVHFLDVCFPSAVQNFFIDVRISNEPYPAVRENVLIMR